MVNASFVGNFSVSDSSKYSPQQPVVIVNNSALFVGAPNFSQTFLIQNTTSNEPCLLVCDVVNLFVVDPKVTFQKRTTAKVLLNIIELVGVGPFHSPEIISVYSLTTNSSTPVLYVIYDIFGSGAHITWFNQSQLFQGLSPREALLGNLTLSLANFNSYNMLVSPERGLMYVIVRPFSVRPLLLPFILAYNIDPITGELSLKAHFVFPPSPENLQYGGGGDFLALDDKENVVAFSLYGNQSSLPLNHPHQWIDTGIVALRLPDI